MTEVERINQPSMLKIFSDITLPASVSFVVLSMMNEASDRCLLDSMRDYSTTMKRKSSSC